MLTRPGITDPGNASSWSGNNDYGTDFVSEALWIGVPEMTFSKNVTSVRKVVFLFACLFGEGGKMQFRLKTEFSKKICRLEILLYS